VELGVQCDRGRTQTGKFVDSHYPGRGNTIKPVPVGEVVDRV